MLILLDIPPFSQVQPVEKTQDAMLHNYQLEGICHIPTAQANNNKYTTEKSQQ